MLKGDHPVQHRSPRQHQTCCTAAKGETHAARRFFLCLDDELPYHRLEIDRESDGLGSLTIKGRGRVLSAVRAAGVVRRRRITNGSPRGTMKISNSSQGRILLRALLLSTAVAVCTSASAQDS